MFASNSTLDDQGQEVPFFPTGSENQIVTPWVTAKEVSKRIRELESSKATGRKKIPVVVSKKLVPRTLSNSCKVVQQMHPGGMLPRLLEAIFSLSSLQKFRGPVTPFTIPAYQPPQHYQ